ncbi:hypothetical protein [Pelomonas sp. BJYL3]|uniref:hypothetical protein n=1 Tax=Pelomonas sp. BJYL3 TaxID=2976697 RepID=UPI0022B405A8|nr:hypothetical protein [Pelomonas sp. BJYL3]
MSLLRAWLVLLMLWLACLGLLIWLRSLNRRQAIAWLQWLRWAAIGAVLAGVLAAAMIHFF